MAGYVTKQVGHVYDGTRVAATDLENGTFAYIDRNGEAAPTPSTADTIMRVAKDGKETLWGLDAVRLDVVSVGIDEVYFVEGEFEIDDTTAYDTSEYTIKAGKPVKMKRLLPGEQVIMSVGSTLYAALADDSLVQPAADGTIAAYSTTPATPQE